MTNLPDSSINAPITVATTTTLASSSSSSGNMDHHNQKESKAVGLPARVAQWYYKHGLFLSSYPTCASSLAIIVVLFSCYPLLNIPLPGTIPTKVILPYADSAAEAFYKQLDNDTQRNQFNVKEFTGGGGGNVGGGGGSSGNGGNSGYEPPFPWAQTDPFVYIQQIILRTSVAPWNTNLYLTDAYRGPLSEVFKLLEIVRNHEVNESKISLGHLCLHVEKVKRRSEDDLFPEYNCLVLSPANFWQQSQLNFNRDSNLLNTIFHHHNFQKSKVSTAEMILGMQMQDSGIKRYPIRTRPRVIQYAITLVLREYDPIYISTLREKLGRHYPLNQDVELNRPTNIMYIYYPGEFNWLEFMPMLMAFVVVFLYVYFSVRKIEVIKSRFVLAISAVITVLGSLMMSLGLCFFFGLTISLQSKGVFQYLVILVGLENVMVITKSVLSTDDTFDVKIRVAQGLSKEGWTISTTLLTEITILTIGLATFVPVIQEFCIFAIVGLISDFFLQMMLFSTVVALDIKRIDYAETLRAAHSTTAGAAADGPRRFPYRNSTITSSFTINRSRSHPKLSALDRTPADLSAPMKANDAKKIPKRLRIVDFWARTRLFQRAFMMWMVLWICSIIYNSQIFEQLFLIEQNKTSAIDDDFGFNSTKLESLINENGDVAAILDNGNTNHINNNNNFARSTTPPYATGAEEQLNFTDQLYKLKHPDYDTNSHLSNFHWSSILRNYNISVSGKYVTVLPAIRISHTVPPDVAMRIRNKDEKPSQHFQWKALAVALDPIDFSDLETNELPMDTTGNTPLYPKSPMEIFLATILCCISVFVMTYMMVVFYRCICTRNYAEWRASWSDGDVIHPKLRQRVLEGVPIQVKGHMHRIECLITDGMVAASSCLEGQIKLWDANNGELISSIDRKQYFQINRSISGGESSNQQMQPSSSASSSSSISPSIHRVIFNFGSHSGRLKERNWSPIWCLDYLDNIIAVGCADGRVEFWEGSSGTLKCIYESESKYKHGVTNIHLAGNRVVAARLSGRIDFLRLETYNQGRHIDWGFTSAYRRTHVRTGSTGSPSAFNTSSLINTKEELRCILEEQHQGHQQPITCMEVVGETVFTGSQDHTLKVFKLDLGNLLYTLHGHCGPITCLFIDHYQPDTGGSGSQDGLLCVWEFLTGACMYSIQAHNGAIVSLVCAHSYVISVGADERLCIWERFQGHLLNTINISYVYTSLLMLTPSLLITGRPGSLIVWDVRSGEPTREVKLDCVNLQICPKVLLPSSGSVICDYGNELRIVRFPLVADKSE